MAFRGNNSVPEKANPFPTGNIVGLGGHIVNGIRYTTEWCRSKNMGRGDKFFHKLRAEAAESTYDELQRILALSKIINKGESTEQTDHKARPLVPSKAVLHHLPSYIKQILFF
jgi:hypothetical protein